jgi:DNA polymerase-3 subunit beta
MKLAIQRDELRDAIANVQNIVSSRSTLPMLQYVLLSTEENALKLVATDLEVGIECVTDCEKVKTKGSVSLPCKKLHEVVNNLPPGTINISVSEGNVLSLDSGVVRYKLMGMSPEEFPKSPEVKQDKTFSMPEAELKEMIRKVSFSISTDPNRINITGLLLALVDKELRLVTTDGRRLSLGSCALENAPEGDSSCIIPRKTVMELERLLGGEGDTQIFLSDNQIAFKFRNILIISNLIDGMFPNYDQVIPRNYEKEIIAPIEPFAIATKRAQVMTTDRYNLVKYEISKGKMVVTTNCPEVGELKDELDIEYSGDAIEVGFNPQFILDALKVVEEERVKIQLKDAQSSGLMIPDGNDNFLYVVMPVRL